MQMYQMPISLYSFKVRLALALKGVRLPMMEPHEGSYRSAAYRVVVPPGTVPALVGAGLVLIESDAIIEYLDELHVGVRLVDGTPERKARIRMVSRLNDLHLEPQIRSLFPHVALSKRDAQHVGETRTRLDGKLALLEWALDAEGPFTIDDELTLPDCGVAVTMTWFYALSEMLPKTLKPGARLNRVYDALCSDPVAGPDIGAYRGLVDAWVRNTLAS
jgi:glutathione S-transferase